jgi:hypothetical protein
MKKLDLKIAANSKDLATLTGEVTKLRVSQPSPENSSN